MTYANINLWATLLGAVICLPSAGCSIASVCAARVRADRAAWRRRVEHEPSRQRRDRAVPAGAGHARHWPERAVCRQYYGGREILRPAYRCRDGRLLRAAERLLRGGVRRGRIQRPGCRVAHGVGADAFGLVLFAAPVVLLLRERAGWMPSKPASGEGLPLSTALRTPAFWIFGGATSLFGLVSSGLGLFNEAVLAERGFDQPTYVTFLAATSIIALVGQLLCGWLTLRWSMQRLLGVAMFIYAAALAALPFLATLAQLWIFAALIGLAGGMITVIFFAVWRQAFGPAHLGRIQGAAQMLTVVASAIGPLIFAKSAELTGSYTPVLWTLAPGVLLLSIAAFGCHCRDRARRRESHRDDHESFVSSWFRGCISTLQMIDTVH